MSSLVLNRNVGGVWGVTCRSLERFFQQLGVRRIAQQRLAGAAMGYKAP